MVSQRVAPAELAIPARTSQRRTGQHGGPEDVPDSGPLSPNKDFAQLPLAFRELSITVTESSTRRSLHSHLDDDEAKDDKKKKKKALLPEDLNLHQKSVNELCTLFNTHPTIGLEAATVKRKQKTDGKNTISVNKPNYVVKFLGYLFGGFCALLWLACILTFISWRPLGDPNPAPINLGVAILLLVIIFFAATFYAVQDFSAMKVMKSIMGLLASTAIVIRDSQSIEISADEICVGDILCLAAGNRVAADARLIQVSSDLKFDRSLLTGEADAINGHTAATDDNYLESKNICFSGTSILEGTGLGIVLAIGDRTMIGRLSQAASKVKPAPSTLQKELTIFTLIISIAAIVVFVVAMIAWAANFRKYHAGFETASAAVLNAIGVLTAFVPQGLPICVTLGLTIVAKRMRKNNLLVKSMTTVETLGTVNVLCSDKTGTLTMGRMSVMHLATMDGPRAIDDLRRSTDAVTQSAGLLQLHQALTLCCGATFLDGQENLPLSEKAVAGNATDAAVLRCIETIGQADKTRDTHDKLFEIAFNSRNKWMLTLVKEKSASLQDEYKLYLKGAPDILFGFVANVIDDKGQLSPWDEEQRRKITEQQLAWSNTGRRVIAVISKRLPAKDVPLTESSQLETWVQTQLKDMTLLGMLALVDPPRPEIKRCLKTMRTAGVRVFMVTGDFQNTAEAIAKDIGLITTEKSDTAVEVHALAQQPLEIPAFGHIGDKGIFSLVLKGSDLIGLTPKAWDVVAYHYSEIVFARTTPEQKLMIVRELKARGDNTVAVTGDGVNDSPALKAADVGLAMNAGSDVAKDASNMILLTNDFTSIEGAIENGRLVFANLRRALIYLMSAGSYAELMANFITTFLGAPSTLSTFLMCIFCVTNDVVMSINLMYEKADGDLMNRLPRNAKKDRLTDWRFFFAVYLWYGLMIWVVSMAMMFHYLDETWGLGVKDVLLAFENWQDGYKGLTMDELTEAVSVGGCIYYITMLIMNFGTILCVRSNRLSMFETNLFWGPRANLRLLLGMAASILIGIVVLYGPGIQSLFSTAPIPGKYWGIPFALAAGMMTIDEIRKWIVRRYPTSFVAYAAW